MENTARQIDFTAGIHAGIHHNDYHRLPAVNNSYLKKLDKVPAAARVPDKDTASKGFGRAFHVYVLEGEDAFNAECIILPAGLDRRTKAGKEQYAELQLSGKELVKEEEFDRIAAMNAAIRNHPLAVKMLAEGVSEMTALWTDGPTGLPCKCRPDRIPAGETGVLLDLKSCADVSRFERAVLNYHYYRQAPWYIDGVNEAARQSGRALTVDAMAFIACEPEAPHHTEVFVLDEDFVKVGREDNRRLIEMEAKCRAANFWPNYNCAEDVLLYKPNWMI